MIPPTPRSTLFPYTTLFLSLSDEDVVINLKWFKKITRKAFWERYQELKKGTQQLLWGRGWDMASTKEAGDYTDRKSTRLNSSHVEISYAVFCLKKKKKKRNV